MSLLAATLLRPRPGNRQAVSDVSLEASNDAKLVQAARDGDRAAFGHLFDLYARMVHGIILTRVPVNDVDDLVQDVFMTALRRLSTLRDTRSFGGWLAAIARNRAKDYHRRSAPETQMPADPADVGDEIAGADQNQDRPAAEILETIRTLPDAYRETLILRLVEGMTGPEIASRTGLTHGSVRVNLHRGMQQLRERLDARSNTNLPKKETS